MSDKYKYIEITSDKRSFLQKIFPDMSLDNLINMMKLLFPQNPVSKGKYYMWPQKNNTIEYSFPSKNLKGYTLQEISRENYILEAPIILQFENLKILKLKNNYGR